jgi:hypothetical protein
MTQNKKAPYLYKMALHRIREKYCFDGWIGEQDAQVFFVRGWTIDYFERVVKSLGEDCSLQKLIQLAKR